MKFKSTWVLIVSILGAQHAEAQFPASANSANLGAMYGYGWSEGPAKDQSSLFTQGTYKTKVNVYAFNFNFVGAGEKKGFGAGGILAGSIGGASDEFMGEDLGGGWGNIDGKWSSDFGLFFDGKLGPGVTYCLPDQQMRFGVRYFNWYQANSFGGTYDNSDDAAALGVTVDWKKLGLSYSYGSDAIPGFLVDASAWDSHEIEAKYLVRESESLNVMVGVRALTQILQIVPQATGEPDTKGTLIGLFVLIR